MTKPRHLVAAEDIESRQPALPAASIRDLALAAAPIRLGHFGDIDRGELLIWLPWGAGSHR
jgi:hypothetical protein